MVMQAANLRELDDRAAIGLWSAKTGSSASAYQ
jgi:hypothetical protein